MNSPSGKKKILFINLYTEMGGGEVVLYNMLREIDRTRYEPVMMFNGTGPFVEKVEALGIATAIVPFQTFMLKLLPRPKIRKSFRESCRLIREYIETNPVDIIHCSDVLALMMVSAVVRQKKIPLVYSIIFLYEMARLFVFDLIAPRLVSAIIVSTPTMKKFVRRKTLFPNKRIHVIPNGVDFTLFRPKAPGDKDLLRREYHIPDDKVIIGMVGRFDPAKGQQVFVRAAARLLSQPSARDLVFCIVGGVQNAGALPHLQKYYEKVCREIEKAGLQGQVILTGHREDVPAVMRSFDLLVCPSLNEGFGLVVLEGLAAELPIVATTAVGALDFFRGHESILLAEPGDSDSLADSLEKGVMIARFRRAVPYKSQDNSLQQFTWRSVAQEHETVYGSILL